MIYVLDANAVYEYYGREKLFMDRNDKIKHLLFKRFLDDQPYKFITTSVLIEIAVHFRNDFQKYTDIRNILADKGIMLIHSATERFIDEQYTILKTTHNNKMFVFLTEHLMCEKATCETNNVYLVLNVIMALYFEYIITRKHPQIPSALTANLYSRFEITVRDDYCREINNTIKKGYQSNVEKQEAKRAFLTAITEWYHHFNLILDAFVDGKGFRTLSKSEIVDIIKKSEAQLKASGLDADKAVKQVLYDVPYFTSDNFEKDFHRALKIKHYSILQSEYMTYITRSWLKARKRIDKNDFFDMYFLNVIDRKKEPLGVIRSLRTEFTSVIDDRVALITFDKAVVKFLKKNHPLSYDEINKFCIKPIE